MDVDAGSSAGNKTKWYTDMAMQTQRDGMEVKAVANKGLIEDWEACEAILEHTFKNRLLTNPSKPSLQLWLGLGLGLVLGLGVRVS